MEKAGSIWESVGNTPLIRIKSLSEMTGCHIHTGKPNPAEPDEQRAAPAQKKNDKHQWKALGRLEAAHQLSDMVTRLNSKSTFFQSPVRFELETGSRHPKILMLSNDQVISRFENEDLIDLERSLHDMAGFRFSFET